ncbi:winged helix DNA-binding protein [Haloactinospora alba]|uniref:Winged helix DNA-binding protein n=1 Tax=Haloactinospora alba TaxID=405555 RepID=A0A543N9A9_9ACTN|nr:winged helix DNA-binding domain-containing protein [Haloactinospora alba]TQN28390.1 winged helix DNA-binding protein [Haloactinospora alba]
MRVTWDRVLAWRLRRQFLESPTTAHAEEVVGRLCGVQAQVAAPAATAVGIRQKDPEPDGIEHALSERSLLKTWSMRGTLHLLPARDAANYLSVIASARTWEKPAWQRAFGATPRQVADLVEAVAELLDGRVLTRDELVSHLVRDPRFSSLEEQLRSGWGTLLKPLAWQGALCHGPKDGNATTFTRPASFVPDWPGIPDPDEAAPAVIAAYLGAHGPATPEMLDAWLTRNSLRKAPLRRWFADMGDRLTEVDVAGRSAYLLTEHAEELADTRPQGTVRLLGAFDQYVLGAGTKETEVLPGHHRSKVSRTAGWISPVVVLDGRIVGTWELDGGRVTVSLFPDAQQPPWEEVEAEVSRIARAGGHGELELRSA